MRRFLFILLPVTLGLALTSRASPLPSLEYATADGRIVGTVSLPDLRLVPPPLIVDLYLVPETFAEPAALPTDSSGNGSSLLWGYEANFGSSQLLAYDIGPPVTMGNTCVPDAAAGGPTGNGRGVAFDPLDGNLWITRLTNFTGDGLIHKVRPPNVSPGVCVQVEVMPFGDGPGGQIQDDIGALDVDESSRHIWAAGYAPIVVQGVERSYIYLVNRNSGVVIKSCWVPFDDSFGVGNDTLSFARLQGLPGSGEYILTDAGEAFTDSQTLFVIDAQSCKHGNQATIVVTYAKTNCGQSSAMTAADLEHPGLLATDGASLCNHGGPPFPASSGNGFWGNTSKIEDFSLCAFRALVGGGEDEYCPYGLQQSTRRSSPRMTR